MESGRATQLEESKALARRQQLAEAPAADPSAALDAPAPSDNSQGPDAGIARPSVPGSQTLPAGSSPMSSESLPGGSKRDDDSGGRDAKRSSPGDDGLSEEEEDSPANRRENLRASTMRAALATLAGEAESEDGDQPDQITKQTSKLNHWMLEAEIEMITSDFCTLGLSLFITLPTRIVFCSILALELRHAFSGTKSMIPYFPTLTFSSFYPPMTDPPDVLPNLLLQIAVAAYIVFIGLITVLLGGLVAIALTALGSAARGGVFSIAKTLFGL